MPNTSVKLYGNPFMQYKVMARTQNSDAQINGAIFLKECFSFLFLEQTHNNNIP